VIVPPGEPVPVEDPPPREPGEVPGERIIPPGTPFIA